MPTRWLHPPTPPTREAPHAAHGTPPHLSAPTMAAAALFAQWHSSVGGLTSEEAQRRLTDVGPNEPARRRRGVALDALLTFLANPLVLILLIASGVSALLGDIVNAVLIALMVVLSVLLNFLQTYRSQRAAARLREAVAPTASVLRDGVWGDIARHTLVPGDVLRLTAGDQVPADARLLETADRKFTRPFGATTPAAPPRRRPRLAGSCGVPSAPRPPPPERPGARRRRACPLGAALAYPRERASNSHIVASMTEKGL